MTDERDDVRNDDEDVFADTGKPSLADLIDEADGGCTASMVKLGLLHEGIDPPNWNEAWDWFERAGSGGDVRGLAAMGRLCATSPAFVGRRRLAFGLTKRAADAGDADAQCRLGRMYLGHPELEIDVAEAEHWLRKSADQGCAEGMYSLGLLMAEDETVLHYPIEGANYVEMAAMLGHVAAAAWLAYAYRVAYVLPRSFELSKRWGEFAARRGSNDALYQLGMLHGVGSFDGASCERTCRDYLERAARGGSRAAAEHLGARCLHPAPGERNLPLGYAMHVIAAELGSPIAMVSVGDCLMNGIGTAENRIEGRAFYETAHAMGYLPAANRVAKCLLYGLGGRTDVERGLRLLESAVEKDEVGARIELADWLANGPIDDRDTVRARHQLQMAASTGSAEAVRLLATPTFTDPTKPNGATLAASMLRRACELGSAEAMFELAVLHERGKGVTRDLEASIGLLRSAAELGHEAAKARLKDTAWTETVVVVDPEKFVTKSKSAPVSVVKGQRAPHLRVVSSTD